MKRGLFSHWRTLICPPIPGGRGNLQKGGGAENVLAMLKGGGHKMFLR